MKKVLFVVAKKDFRDPEYFVPREILEKFGFEIKTASNIEAGKIAVGDEKGEAKIDISLGDAKADDFDVVIFVGGPGAIVNLDNEQSHNLARETIAQNKLLAAICIAPVILAKAGVLSGKKATVWSSLADKQPIEILIKSGAEYTGEDTTQDGNIVTANGPRSAKDFAEKIVDYFK